MTPPLLKIEDLACGYGNKAVVQGANLHLHAGEVLALIGPNGAGKTTLLHTLCRILPKLSGRIELAGKPAESYSQRGLARLMALAPQRAAQTAWPLTVREAVRLGRAPHRGWLMPLTREDEHAVEGAMARLGVQELADRSLPTLSGGEVRRLLLARALAQQPRILLLDEPATYLDLHYQAELVGAVRGLAKEEGLAVILTIHDLPLAALCADRIALMAPGRLCVTGTPAEVLTEAQLKPIYGPNLEILKHPKTGAPLVIPTAPTSHTGTQS